MRAGLRLFAVSFTALFLELMVIRWAPSSLRLVAYYANLLLISSFLGLGIGSLTAGRRKSLFWLFPILVFAEVSFMFLCRRVLMPGSEGEARFFLMSGARALNYAALITLFAANAAVFVPLGQKIGELFEDLPPLRAYAWDLGGSLCGTLFFGFFSFRFFSPLAGLGAVAVCFFLLASGKSRWLGTGILLAAMGVMSLSIDSAALWSPYYYVTVEERGPHPVAVDLKDPPDKARLRSMKDPPIYFVHVNQDFYHPDMTIDPGRYSDPAKARAVSNETASYFLPYALLRGRRRALVLGAGGGTDVQAALMSGVGHVDAVEIDPAVVALSRMLNPSAVYDDPRVSVHIDDARAFMRRAEPGYDLAVFGWLDSQALFSQMSSIRLDGYVYTVESMKAAYSLLEKDGMLVLTFMAGREWLADKLARMVRDATGKRPVIYISQGQIVLCVPKGSSAAPPARFGRFELVAPDKPPYKVEPPTDDWPYLYLSKKAIPGDYLAVISLLAAVSIGSILAFRGPGFGRQDAHFFFLGFAFMLLETTRIADCSLYFGTTWLVTLFVVAGVLAMALAANLAASRLRRFSPALYLPLFVSLAAAFLVPRGLVLSWSYLGRLLWTALAVPLPVFFAGLIFSMTFRETRRPSALFGANLLGAMAGGFCEYLGMATGQRALSLLIAAAYAASLFCRGLSALE